ncbi:hypothetical protein PLICRDRAFT_41918 [Plicaturopsis crispa FD-325 SS-3]|nr:hypothetical protein PLICRDRAFT_41918 [Plicaturopsis crispa FD-325 SS-3]
MSVPAKRRPGREYRVYANCFEIKQLPTVPFYHYDDFEPEVTGGWGTRLRKQREIVAKLQLDIKPEVFTARALYDGNKNLYSSLNLQLGNGHFLVPMPGKQSVYTVKISRAAAAVIDPRTLNELVVHGRQSAATTTAVNILQLLVRAALDENYPHNVRSYFTEAGKEYLGRGLELWRGFFQSVRPTMGKMIVNIDVSMAVMFCSGPLVDVAMSFLGVRDERALHFPANHPQFRALEKFLKGLLFTVVGGRADSQRRRKIQALVPNAGYYKFDTKASDGTEMTTTVYEHYNRLGVRIDPKMFGVRAGRNVFPAKLCKVLNGQFYKKKVPQDLTSNVVSFATKRPEHRLQAIQSGTGISVGVTLQTPVLAHAASDYMRRAGMVMSSEPMKILGRVLDTPSVGYASGVDEKPYGGKWNVLNKRFATPGKIEAWGVVNFIAAKIPMDQAMRGIMLIQNCCRTADVREMADYRQADGMASISSVLNVAAGEIAKKTGKNPDLIFIILPESAAEIRRAVKRWGDVQVGVVTQCVKESKIKRAAQRNDTQYGNNLALKINVRLGGTNSIVKSGAMARLRTSPFMVVVSHAGAGISDQPSVASLVWSSDPNASQYTAYSGVQEPRTEGIKALGPMMLKALMQFAKKAGPPRKIIFFREYEVVAKKEIETLRVAINKMWSQAPPGTKPYPVSLTFIVVGKRHHVRFFPATPPPMKEDKSGNCPAGFVVDKGLTSPIASDFYLQSHSGILGTSRPAHYIVLEDQNFQNNVDDLQELAFSLCHVYARATRSVSIPAPLVCSRGMDFYFQDGLRYGDDITTEDGERAPFDIKKWEQGFDRIHAHLEMKMFFL